LDVFIPDNVSEEEALSDLTQSLSETLGVDEERIILTLDPETGEVTYSVTTNDYDEANAILSELESDDIIESISSDVVSIDSVTPDADIIAEVSVVVNADEVDVSLQQAENQIDALLPDNYNSDVNVNYVTASPSITPSMTPSKLPSSTIPSALPTITGSVVFVDLNKMVSSSLSDEEIATIVTDVENTFGVYPGDVEVEVTYDVMGSVTLVTDGSEIPEEELASTLQQSIASTLNVHPSDVSIVVDSETGVATYTISSPTAEEASNLQEVLQDTETNNAIASVVTEEIPAITGVSVDPDYGVYADVQLVVDATNAVNVDESMETFDDSIGDEWIVDMESVFITSLPTVLPTLSPTMFPTSPLPTSSPSITGLIVTIDVSSPVTKELTADEIEAMENVAIDSFDVSNEDVTAEVSYVATGSMQLSIPEDTSENEIADALTSTIADLLGIHPRDVSITDVNLETGEVQYEVSSNEFEDISTVQEALQLLSNDDIESSIQDVLPEVEVESNDVNDDIAVDVTIIVDGSNAGSISDARTDVNDFD
jgi:phenylpyruvate tautomerase PptA (4-oxalocrotonate tautomerase family)